MEQQQPLARGHHSFKLRPPAKQQPKPEGRGKTIALLVAPMLGFVILVGIIGVANNGDSSQATQQTRSVITAEPKSPLLDVSGSGTKTTQRFTAGSGWDFYWSYDYASPRQLQGNFAVAVINTSDASISTVNQPLNQAGAKHTGVEHYHTGGTFYLAIDSLCSWHMIAKG